jgi:hypothetical protein
VPGGLRLVLGDVLLDAFAVDAAVGLGLLAEGVLEDALGALVVTVRGVVDELGLRLLEALGDAPARRRAYVSSSETSSSSPSP